MSRCRPPAVTRSSTPTGCMPRARPTVLVYGHYDVQPVDPLDLWVRPPFEPRIEDGRIYARGAADDKGQVHLHLWAARAWLETVGSLPVNLRFVFEGEEESGLDPLRWLAGGEPPPPGRRPRGHQRHRLPGGQPARHHGRPAGPGVRPDRRHRTRRSTSTSGPGAAMSRTRPSRWRASSRRSRAATASVAVPGFYDEVRDR